ncbi:MAG: hypothetical protein M3Q79_00300 [bacterium]|nr:hypothetical protein [bacterium]
MDGVELGEYDPLDHKLKRAFDYIREQEILHSLVSDELYCGGPLPVDQVVPPSTKHGAVDKS